MFIRLRLSVAFKLKFFMTDSRKENAGSYNFYLTTIRCGRDLKNTIEINIATDTMWIMWR